MAQSSRTLGIAVVVAALTGLLACGGEARLRPRPPSEAVVLVSQPAGDAEPQWVARPGSLFLERTDAVLFVPWSGARRLRWARAGRRITLGGRIIAHDWTRLSGGAIGRRLDAGAVAGWLILDAGALVPGVVRRLARRPGLRLAVVCPLDRPCDLAPLARLGRVLTGLSLKEARLAPAAARHLGSLTRLRFLSLRGARLPVGFWRRLAALGRLEALDLAGAIAQGWHRLPRALTQLRWLDLSFTGITGLIMPALLGLPGLRTLRLAATRLGDDDLARLAAHPNLREIDLSLTALGDRGLAALGDLSRLRSLDLRDTAVTDLGLRALAGLRELRLLLAPGRVSDPGIRWLDGLGALEGLSLRGAAVSGPGLLALVRLPRLWWLDLVGTDVTEEGLARFRRARHVWGVAPPGAP